MMQSLVADRVSYLSLADEALFATETSLGLSVRSGFPTWRFPLREPPPSGDGRGASSGLGCESDVRAKRAEALDHVIGFERYFFRDHKRRTNATKNAIGRSVSSTSTPIGCSEPPLI